MPSRPMAVLFDLDGTLLDTMGIFSKVASSILCAYTDLTVEQAAARYLETSGVPFHRQLGLIVPGHPLSRRMSEEFEARKVSAVASIRMSSETIAALSNLQNLGIGIGVSSNNSQHNVQEFVSGSPIHFDFALGYTGSLYKGSPHIFHVETFYRCQASDLLFVGDSISDAVMARNCSVPFVGKLGTHAESEFRSLDPSASCISSIAELPSLIISKVIKGGTYVDSK